MNVGLPAATWRGALASCAAWTASLAMAQAGAAPAEGAVPSVEAGRTLFETHCARCHGGDARGSANGPDLRERVRGMSRDGFANAVLRRYRWTLPATSADGESEAREALMRGVLVPQDGSGAMPAWQGQPEVAQGVQSLYEYLGRASR
jgi:mono/diheme cytochrome c family protein